MWGHAPQIQRVTETTMYVHTFTVWINIIAVPCWRISLHIWPKLVILSRLFTAVGSVLNWLNDKEKLLFWYKNQFLFMTCIIHTRCMWARQNPKIAAIKCWWKRNGKCSSLSVKFNFFYTVPIHKCTTINIMCMQPGWIALKKKKLHAIPNMFDNFCFFANAKSILNVTHVSWEHHSVHV